MMACTPKKEIVKTKDVEVVVEAIPSPISGFDRIETRYSLVQGKCRIAWQTTSAKKEKNLEVQLSNRTECDRPFSEASSLHQLVLAKVLKDYPPMTIKSLSTGGLRRLQPDGSWNLVVAKAAEVSKEYLEFREKYPNHPSKKSINSIFVDLVRQTQAHAPFKQMLATLGLNFELYEVEKVFNVKNDKGKTLIHEAGSFWWKPE